MARAVPSRRLIGFTLAVIGALLPQAVRANDYDLPGVPLSGRVISGEVGGAITDRVYSLSAAAGTVLVATVQGESGAELGLYIFGEEATSVVSSDPVASSAKPGSSQLVRVVLPTAETIYLNVNGRNADRPYRFVLTVSAVIDSTPPRISVARAAPNSRPTHLCAKVAAEDALAGVSSVAVLPIGRDASPDWQAYEGAGRYCGSYDVPDGSTEIRVLARNQLGYVSSVKAGATTVDSVTPVAGAPRPRSDALLDPRPVVRWRFSEPIKGVGQKSVSVFAFDQLGKRLPGTTKVTDGGLLLSWTAGAAIAPGVLVNIQVLGVSDLAGNTLGEVEPFAAFRKVRTSLSITSLKFTGDRQLLRLAVSDNLLGKTIRFLARTEGQEDVLLRTVTVGQRVSYIRVRPGTSTRLVAVWSGSETLNRAQDSVASSR